MLSNHVLCEAIDTEIYPKAKEIQKLVFDLYRKQFAGRILGPQGLTGSNELDFTIQILNGTISLLKAIAKEQKIEITSLGETNGQ